MLNIMIVDDEKYACDRLEQLVNEIPGCHVRVCSQNGLDAVEKLEVMDIDVVLMDIHMPVMNGLEAARHMNKNSKSPHIIFTTAYRQYALPAFEVNARGFLLKPIIREQLKAKLYELEKLDKSKRSAKTRYVREVGEYKDDSRRHIYCRIANQLSLVSLEDIIYFKSVQKYTMLKHINGSHFISETLKNLESEFKTTIIRVHRNTLVNKVYMKALIQDQRRQMYLHLKCTGDTLLVSKRYAPNVRKYLKLFSLSQAKT